MTNNEMARSLFRSICDKKSANMMLSHSFRGQYVLLRNLDAAGGQLFAGELTARLGVTSGRITTAIKRLSSLGQVEREVDKEDGRRVIVRITQEGRRVLLEHENIICDQITRGFNKFTPEEAQEFYRLMRKLMNVSEEEC